LDDVSHLLEPEDGTGAEAQPVWSSTRGTTDTGVVEESPSAHPSAIAPTPARPSGGTNEPDTRWRSASTSTATPSRAEDPRPAQATPAGLDDAAMSPRRRRWRRTLAAVLVLLLVLFLALDRLAAHAAASQMASQIQKSQELATGPQASVGGFPFLTQVVMGDYKDIGLRIRRVAPVSDLCVDDIDVHLKEARLPLGTLVRGKVNKVPIDRVVGTVRLTYPDLNTYLAHEPGDIQLAASGSGMRVSAPVDVPLLGQIRMFGDVRATVENNRLTISPTKLGVNGLGSVPIPDGAVQALTVAIPLDDLPMNLQPTSATVTSAGIEITAETSHLTLDTTKTAPAQLHSC
jgi:hypothetical protein